MANAGNDLAAAALAVALIALFGALGQLLQQYFGTADGYRRCQESVVGPWASKTRLRFRWREVRFETLYTVPHIVLHRITWTSSEIPDCPYENGVWIPTGKSGNSKDAGFTNLLVSGKADQTSELVTWLRFLGSIQWLHKRMLARLSRVNESLAEKNDLSLELMENRKLTIPVCLFEERSWDFMPPDVVKPYARINVGDLAVLARRLGMTWERFEPSDGILRASGNGYNLTSISVRSVGTMAEITEVVGSSEQSTPLPWVIPVIPEQAEKNMLIIPCAAADKMTFGVLPGVGSDFYHRDFDVGRPEAAAYLIRIVAEDVSLLSALETETYWRQVQWFPGITDILGFVAPMMYRPELGITGVSSPSDEILFIGVTAASSGRKVFDSFNDGLLTLLTAAGDEPAVTELRWVYNEAISLEPSNDDWLDQQNWIARYQADEPTATRTPPQHAFYHSYREATRLLINMIGKYPTRRVINAEGFYQALVKYHVRGVFRASVAWVKDTGNPTREKRYQEFSAGTKNSKVSMDDLWAHRMKLYFRRLPSIVDDLYEQGFGSTEMLQAAWALMMLRGICWHRCHTLVPGKVVPIQYCGSQLPVYLG